jgi:methylglyoxal/glyoxal reductase
MPVSSGGYPRSLDARVPTSQGLAIPCVGLGVFQTPPGAPTRNAVAYALRIGYRLIDTASLYGNEADVGEALRASGVPRDEVVVTTKLWHSDHGFEEAQSAARKSLERLGLDRIDLYLIHWPRAKSPEARLGSWRALEKLRDEGVCRAIGVSNYTVRHLEELRKTSDVVPAVDQVEFHPFVYDPQLVRYCADRGILIEAWSPLTRGRHLENPVVRSIASEVRRTAAQVLIRWGLQHRAIELPKSVREDRIRENSNVFDFALDPGQMTRLDGLAGGERVGWDPSDIP